jgi:hypothetical protein
LPALNPLEELLDLSLAVFYRHAQVVNIARHGYEFVRDVAAVYLDLIRVEVEILIQLATAHDMEAFAAGGYFGVAGEFLNQLRRPRFDFTALRIPNLVEVDVYEALLLIHVPLEPGLLRAAQ